jgi:hypothetical protein
MVGGLLYLVDGSNFVSYNPATNTTDSLSDSPIDFSSWAGLAPYKGKIYGDGGDDEADAFAVYDIATDQWATLPGMPDFHRAVLGAAIDPVTGTFYDYGSYHQDHFYRYDITTGRWLATLKFPQKHLDDGGIAYVSAKGLQGIYATYGQASKGFTRYVTPAPHH